MKKDPLTSYCPAEHIPQAGACASFSPCLIGQVNIEEVSWTNTEHCFICRLIIFCILIRILIRFLFFMFELTV